MLLFCLPIPLSLTGQGTFCHVWSIGRWAGWVGRCSNGSRDISLCKAHYHPPIFTGIWFVRSGKQRPTGYLSVLLCAQASGTSGPGQRVSTSSFPSLCLFHCTAKQSVSHPQVPNLWEITHVSAPREGSFANWNMLADLRHCDIQAVPSPTVWLKQQLVTFIKTIPFTH